MHETETRIALRGMRTCLEALYGPDMGVLIEAHVPDDKGGHRILRHVWLEGIEQLLLGTIDLAFFAKKNGGQLCFHLPPSPTGDGGENEGPST